jgi:hypothetical protein
VPLKVGQRYYLFIYTDAVTWEENLRFSTSGVIDIFPVSLYKEKVEKELNDQQGLTNRVRTLENEFACYIQYGEKDNNAIIINVLKEEEGNLFLTNDLKGDPTYNLIAFHLKGVNSN